MEENQTTKKRNYERYLDGETWSPSTGYEQDGGVSASYEQMTDNISSFRDADSPYYVPEEPQNEYRTQTGYVSAPAPVAGYSGYEGLEEPVSMGEWALCIFLNCIPCVGLIMMFVWAFSKDTKRSKANFFKVQLIFMGIIAVVYLLLFLFMLGMGVALG